MSYYLPSDGPDSWRGFLADPDKQWKVGKSARTLAHAWESSDGFPREVRSVLDCGGVPALTDLEIVAGFPEHKVPLPGGSRASQTDVYVLARNELGLASVAVEGKVDESFDSTVDRWLGDSPSPGKLQRLDYLCRHLGLSKSSAAELRYQLLHRTVSAISEARRFHAGTSLMLVHSWGVGSEGFDDYVAFASRLGGTAARGSLTETSVGGLFLAWVDGDPMWLNS